MRNQMRFADRETVKRLREQFPVGCRIVLDEMDDPYVTIPEGTQGTCHGVDDAGNVMAVWDCGSSLSVAFGVDRAHRVATTTEIRESLGWLGKRQRGAKGGGHCPRCGKALEGFERQAVSRYADVAICSPCGQEEALEQAGLMEARPLTAWWCTRDWKL